MDCKKCGNQIKAGAKFCGKCGIKANITQQDNTISGNDEPIKIKFNHLLIFIICIVIFVGIIIVANNKKEQQLESNTNVSSEKLNEQENKKYYDFIDTDYYTFNFTEDELIKGLFSGDSYYNSGFQKFNVDNDNNSTLYIYNTPYEILNFKITNEPKNFKVKKFNISYFSNNNLPQDLANSTANSLFYQGLRAIIFTRNKIYYETDEIKEEIQDITNQLTKSTNGTYQGLKFSLEKDMKTINIYFEIEK